MIVDVCGYVNATQTGEKWEPDQNNNNLVNVYVYSLLHYYTDLTD